MIFVVGTNTYRRITDPDEDAGLCPNTKIHYLNGDSPKSDYAVVRLL